MRILFDGYWWVKGPTSNQNVLRGIVTTWIEHFPADQLALAVPARDTTSGRNSVPQQIKVVQTRLRPHALAAMLETPALARKLSADVSVTQNFAALRGRSAVFLHDVIFQTNPEWFSPRERLYFSLMPLSLRRADLILTSSETEAARVRRANPRAPEIVTVGIAPHPDLLQCEPAPPDGLDNLRDFYLSVGRFNPRKNLSVALEAAVVSGLLSKAHPLVIVGEGEHHTMPLSDAARLAVDHGHIRFLRFVPDPQLAWLYLNARLMIFLSLDEGFGLPPVEALAFGCPVLVSDIPIFHETMGDRATYVEPQHIPAVAEKLRELAHTNRDRRPYLKTSWIESVERIRAAFVKLTG